MVVVDEDSQNDRYVQLSLNETELGKLARNKATEHLGAKIADKIGTDVKTFPILKKIMATGEGLTVEDSYTLLPKMTVVSEEAFKRVFNI